MIKKVIYWMALFLAVFFVVSLKHIGIFIYVYWNYNDFYWADDALRDILSFTIPLYIGLVLKKFIAYKFSIK